jgi:hypothetical protein
MKPIETLVRTAFRREGGPLFLNALVQDIIGEAMRGVGGGQGTINKDLVARKFNSMVLDGKLCAAIRFATDRNGGEVLLPQDVCTKTRRPVMEVLLLQHPDTRIPDFEDPHCTAFEHYDEVPAAMPMYCTPEDLETLALRMSGSAGPSSFDAVMLRNCLLRYGRASSKLRQEMAATVHCQGQSCGFRGRGQGSMRERPAMRWFEGWHQRSAARGAPPH